MIAKGMRGFVAAAVIVLAPLSANVRAQSSHQGEMTPPAKPAEAKPAEKKFTSPFGGLSKDASSPEAQDFDALVKLYDEWAAAEALYKHSQQCGTKADISRAEKLRSRAELDYQSAAKTYVRDWSPRVYLGSQMTDALKKKEEVPSKHDLFTLDGAVQQASHARKTESAKCPKKHHKVITEDDPRYMENYPSHVQPTAPHRQKPDEGQGYYPYPPPSEDGPNPDHPPQTYMPPPGQYP